MGVPRLAKNNLYCLEENPVLAPELPYRTYLAYPGKVGGRGSKLSTYACLTCASSVCYQFGRTSKHRASLTSPSFFLSLYLFNATAAQRTPPQKKTFYLLVL